MTINGKTWEKDELSLSEFHDGIMFTVSEDGRTTANVVISYQDAAKVIGELETILWEVVLREK